MDRRIPGRAWRHVSSHASTGPAARVCVFEERQQNKYVLLQEGGEGGSTWLAGWLAEEWRAGGGSAATFAPPPPAAVSGTSCSGPGPLAQLAVGDPSGAPPRHCGPAVDRGVGGGGAGVPAFVERVKGSHLLSSQGGSLAAGRGSAVGSVAALVVLLPSSLYPTPTPVLLLSPGAPAALLPGQLPCCSSSSEGPGICAGGGGCGLLCLSSSPGAPRQATALPGWRDSGWRVPKDCRPPRSVSVAEGAASQPGLPPVTLPPREGPAWSTAQAGSAGCGTRPRGCLPACLPASQGSCRAGQEQCPPVPWVGLGGGKGRGLPGLGSGPGPLSLVWAATEAPSLVSGCQATGLGRPAPPPCPAQPQPRRLSGRISASAGAAACTRPRLCQEVLTHPFPLSRRSCQ